MYNDPYENLTLHGGTPFVAEGSLNPDEDEITGTLAPVACKVLMKALWLARLARPDILKPIGDLASNVQKWSRNHDRQLLRLIQYLVGTCNHRLVGTVQDSADDLELVLYVDADFCGERAHTKSTSGGYLVLQGPQTWFLLAWVSKRQTSTPRSTTEAEVISLAHSLYAEGLPSLQAALAATPAVAGAAPQPLQQPALAAPPAAATAAGIDR